MDIGNNCVSCNQDTSFGSGRFVNRIPADAEYESLDELNEVYGKKFEDLDTAIKEANKQGDVSNWQTYKEAVRVRNAARKTKEASEVVKGITVQTLEDRVTKLEKEVNTLQTLAQDLSRFGTDHRNDLSSKMEAVHGFVDSAIKATNEQVAKVHKKVEEVQSEVEKVKASKNRLFG